MDKIVLRDKQTGEELLIIHGTEEDPLRTIETEVFKKQRRKRKQNKKKEPECE